ncbi:acetylcholinesterase-1-like [Ixodes scapularis]|uniref:acetylcholinesterase-1-like n=1 Tax=Ixodes scapularis TaxID=6945 RepID=UPI001A9DE561|nr:acetylcholinesterase-1-like [Ixodes scapularis]
MVLSWLVFALPLAIPLSTPASCSTGPIVSTRTGVVRGLRRVVLEDKVVESSTGIPYAKAPVGKRRFRRPEPGKPWNGALDATRPAPACTQTSIVDAKPTFQETTSATSEDCLFLNIWTPKRELSKKRSVMVWLFGGALLTGSATDGAVLAAYGDVVVVTLNYRLGVFGFLYGGTEDAPGNQALYDQALALTWVRDNVDRFGGSPDSITLFGQSSGAWSATFHLISPITQSMVRKAIIQSGGFDRKGIVSKDTDMLKRAHTFAEFFGCSREANSTGKLTAETVDCLRSANSTELSVTERLFTMLKTAFFQPIYGDEFMPVEPRLAKFPGNKDILIGQVENEGAFYISQDFRDTFSQTKPSRKINKIEMEYFLGKIFLSLNLPSLKRVHEEYMGNLQDFDYDALRQALVNARGDSHVVCGLVGAALKFANATMLKNTGAGVYYYKISHVPRCMEREAWLKTTHANDVPYVFGNSLEDGGCAPDRAISRTVMRLWSGFAKKR